MTDNERGWFFLAFIVMGCGGFGGLLLGLWALLPWVLGLAFLAFLVLLCVDLWRWSTWLLARMLAYGHRSLAKSLRTPFSEAVAARQRHMARMDRR
jgi:hypothetical protein